MLNIPSIFGKKKSMSASIQERWFSITFLDFFQEKTLLAEEMFYFYQFLTNAIDLKQQVVPAHS